MKKELYIKIRGQLEIKRTFIKCPFFTVAQMDFKKLDFTRKAFFSF